MGTLFIVAMLGVVVATGVVTGWFRLGRPTQVSVTRHGRHRAPIMQARVLTRRT